MITLILILSVLNFSGLLTAGVLYFKNKYTIVTIDQWNEIATVYNTVVTAGLVDEKGELTSPPELAGGHGFFKEQVEEAYEEDKTK